MKRYYQPGNEIHGPKKVVNLFFPLTDARNCHLDPFGFHVGSLKDFKEFADAVETINDNGVVVAVASPEDVEAANKENPLFSDVKKCL